MRTHLGTFTLSISMWQSAAAAAFECCAWYAAFGKCEYELHKSSRGNGGSLCQLRQARPGRAEQGRPRPVLALRLFGFGLQREREHKKGEKTQTSSRREQQSSARWRWCEPQLVRPWEIYDQEVLALALALAVALENANRMWRHQSSAHLLCRR